MRKIETQMINAIADRRDWKNANTRVIHSDVRGTSEVYLHDNLIVHRDAGGGVDPTRGASTRAEGAHRSRAATCS